MSPGPLSGRDHRWQRWYCPLSSRISARPVTHRGEACSVLGLLFQDAFVSTEDAWQSSPSNGALLQRDRRAAGLLTWGHSVPGGVAVWSRVWPWSWVSISPLMLRVLPVLEMCESSLFRKPTKEKQNKTSKPRQTRSGALHLNGVRLKRNPFYFPVEGEVSALSQRGAGQDVLVVSDRAQ